jgi:NAD(P)-dependent dehydrogenase (short-subunit alcohol dehydrogenase family)
MQRLSNKVAIVTGGAQGIGFGIAAAMAQAGARVVIADLVADKAKEAAERISRETASDGGSSIGMQIDVASKQSVDAAVAQTVEKFGTVDILVNNAAIWKSLERRQFWEVPQAEWDAVFAVNTRGPFLCCCAVAPIMARSGGRIIFIGSATIGTAQATLTHYTASKAALIGLMRCVARELGPQRVCVNMIHPGLTDSGDVPRDYLEARAKNRFIQRVGMPSDIAGAVVFLASDESSFISGQQIFVDGGGILN